jgi:hypothetical protein
MDEEKGRKYERNVSHKRRRKDKRNWEEKLCATEVKQKVVWEVGNSISREGENKIFSVGGGREQGFQTKIWNRPVFT